MPTPAYAKLLMSINGAATQSGGISAAYGSTIQLSGESTDGWEHQRWEIIYFPVGFSTPSGWTLDPVTGFLHSVAVIPPVITLPPNTLWGKWLFRLRINDALTNDKAETRFTDALSGVSIPSDTGLQDLGTFEDIQFNTAWTVHHQANLRLITLGGGGGGPPTGAAGGDLGGNYPNPNVLKIHGATVPVAGGLTTGNVLQVSGVAALIYAAVNLAGGANFVTGNLPIGNIAPGTNTQVFVTNATPATAWVTPVGDWTGAVTANIVGKIKGTTVTTAGGALTTGQSLRVTGVATADWGAVDLANTNAITGILATANIAPGTVGQFFVTGAGPAASWVTAAGDWTGAVTANVVGRIKGTTVTTAGGALTTGQSLRVTGVATADWGAIDLANTSAITGTLPISRFAPGTNGQVLTTVGGVATWAPIVDVNVDAAAAIAVSKLAAGANGTFLSTVTGVPTWTTISGAGGVPSTRTLTAGTGLTGGGDLTVDRTFNVIANVDGSIVVNTDDVQVGILATDAQHGNRGGGALHAAVTNAAAGFAPLISAANRVLLSTNGTSSVWGQVNLASAQVTGLLPVANFALGAANTVLWSDGATNSFVGNPILSTSLRVVVAGTTSTVIQQIAGGGTTPAIYMGNVTPSASNYVISLSSTGNSLILNAPAASGAVSISNGNTISTFMVSVHQVGSTNSIGFGPNAPARIYVVGPGVLGDIPVNDLELTSQAPFGSAITNQSSSNIILNIATPIGAGVTGFVRARSRGVNQVQMGEYARFPTFGTVWLGNVAAASDNWSISGDGLVSLAFGVKSATGSFEFISDTANGPVAGDGFQIAAIQGTGGVNQLVFGTNLTSVAIPTKIRPLARTTDTATADITIEGMIPAGVGVATGTNRDSGNVVLQTVAPTSGGVAGRLKVLIGAVALAAFGPSGLQLGGTGSSTHMLEVLSGTVQIVPFNVTGVVHNNASGVLSSSLIVDADVTGPIAGSKITPNFGSQAVSTTGSLSVASTTITGLGLGLVHSSSGGVLSSSLAIDADIATGAAIAVAKLAPGTNGQFLATSGGVAVWSTISGAGGVPNTRQVVAGAGLTGGGDLTVDRTFDIVAADGTIVVAADSIRVGSITTTNITAGSNGQFLTTSGGAAAWAAIVASSIAAGGTNTVLWSNGTTNSFTGSPILSTSLSIGTNPASVGALRLANNQAINARNAANSVDLNLVILDAGNIVIIGSASASGIRAPFFAAAGVVHTDASGNLSSSTITDSDVAVGALNASRITAGSSGQFLVTAGSVSAWRTAAGDWTGAVDSNIVIGLTGTTNVVAMHAQRLSWDAAVTTAIITQITHLSGSGVSMLIAAQSSLQSGGPFNGGGLDLRGGVGFGGGANGNVLIRNGISTGITLSPTDLNLTRPLVILENTSAALADLQFKGTTGLGNIRMENRGGLVFTGAAEFQFGITSSPSVAIGISNNYVWMNNVLFEPTSNPPAGLLAYVKSGSLRTRSPNGLRTTISGEMSTGASTTYDHVAYGKVATAAPSVGPVSGTGLTADLATLVGAINFSYTVVVTITLYDGGLNNPATIVLTSGGFHFASGGSTNTATDTLNLSVGTSSATCAIDSTGIFTVTVNATGGGAREWCVKAEFLIDSH